MKKFLLIGLMLITTSAFAFETFDAFGNRISNRCNSIYTGRWVFMPAPLPVGWSCMMPDGSPGIVGG